MAKEETIESLMAELDSAGDQATKCEEALHQAKEHVIEVSGRLQAKLEEIRERAGLNGVAEEKPKRGRPKGKTSTERTTFEDREALILKRVRQGRGKPVSLSTVKTYLAETLGRTPQSVYVQLKKDLDKSTQLKIKGKGREQVVVTS